jgi:hypothetical protein
MLYCLIDGRARTSTELAAIAEVTPSTASVHLQRLLTARLGNVYAQGKHRYHSLESAQVAAALEALSVVAGGGQPQLRTNTPSCLREARTCHDHIAGRLGVALHDRFIALGWLASGPEGGILYSVTDAGLDGLTALGVDIAAAQAGRRRLAFACLDWSERRPHLAGALGAAVLATALRKKWMIREPEGRVLTLTPRGARDLGASLGFVEKAAPTPDAILKRRGS